MFKHSKISLKFYRPNQVENAEFQGASSELSICTSASGSYPLLMQLTPRFDPFNTYSLFTPAGSSTNASKADDSPSPVFESSGNKKFSESDDVQDDGSTAGTGPDYFFAWWLTLKLWTIDNKVYREYFLKTSDCGLSQPFSQLLIIFPYDCWDFQLKWTHLDLENCLYEFLDTEADDGSEKPHSCRGDNCNDDNLSDNDEFDEDCTGNTQEQSTSGLYKTLFELKF